MNKEFFTGKNVLIMGLGRFGGGIDVTKFAAGGGAKVVITDLASAQQLSDSIKKIEEFSDIEFHLGSHDPVDFERADIIVANPAVPSDNDFLKLARRHNKFITSQINIFFELCPAPIIGITGANGKSTTAALTAHLLRSASNKRRTTSDEHVWLSGNIGNEPLLTVVDQIASDDLVVLELSSFQLEQLAQIQKAPKVALLTNLTPNHLDRYGTFGAYCAAKENIFKFQKPDRNCPAVSIFNAEDKVGAEWFEKYSQNMGRICIKFSTDDVSHEICDSFKLPGRANLSNLSAANAIAKYFGADDDLIKTSLPEFKPLPHRLELVCQTYGGLVEQIPSNAGSDQACLRRGVSWYNDSKATTPQSAIAAIEAFDQSQPPCFLRKQKRGLDGAAGQSTIIIAGGYDKELPFDELGQKIAENTKAAILFGQTAEKIADAIRNAKMSPLRGLDQPDMRYQIRDTKIEIVDSLAEAVRLANQLAETDDVVLLSPACASYDMFDNFQHRGREFIRLVQEIGC
ncbi:MAG: Mur ligase family protein [Planctomycetota bacterium]|jgi:UDP-N-acetylmuramoylalanine--D-glutamate ligase